MRIMHSIKNLPVEGDIVTSAVYNFDHKRITIPCFQSWPRKLPIHCDYVMGYAQPLHWRLLNLFQ